MDRATVDVYEARARDWVGARRATEVDEATAFAAEVAALDLGGAIADLGCGPGWHAGRLGPRTVALDAARAMLDLVPRQAPGVPLVQGDLAALPFARHSLAGAWASKSYLHLPRRAVPLALHDLHRAVVVGGRVRLRVIGLPADRPEPTPDDGRPPADPEFDTFPDDDFPGRRFSAWPIDLLHDVLVGAGFAVDALDPTVNDAGDVWLRARLTRARTLADTVGPGMRLLVCGLNPSVLSADLGRGFARPGNRFWPAAVASGVVSVPHDPWRALVDDGVGMTDLVKRATPRADELTTAEYRDGLARIERLCGWLQPAAVCFVGLAGWRAAVDRKAKAGPQERSIGGRPVYVMPNTSGINASSSLADLTAHLRDAAGLADRSAAP